MNSLQPHSNKRRRVTPEEAPSLRRQDLYRDYKDADDMFQAKQYQEQYMKYAYGPNSPSGDIYGELARAVRTTEMQREERDRRKKALQTYDDTLRARQRLQLPIIFDRLGLVRYDDLLMSKISDAIPATYYGNSEWVKEQVANRYDDQPYRRPTPDQ